MHSHLLTDDPAGMGRLVGQLSPVKSVTTANVFLAHRLLFVALLIVLFAGCPDYSHLRDAPDYANMTDSGEEMPEAD